MTTSQLERVTAKFNMSARRARMPIYSWFCAEDARALVTEKSTAYWAVRLKEHREYARTTRQDPLTRDFLDRVKPTGKLTFSNSLIELLTGMELHGDAVAAALAKASKYAHCHARKVPGNYYSYREKAGMISYLPAGRALVHTESGTWARDGRQEMKPAKWARSVLAGWQLARLRDEDFSAFASKFAAAENAAAVRLELCDDVGAVYGCRNYSDYVGGSCMQAYPGAGDNGKGEAVGPFYREAGAQVLAIWRGDGRLEARAIFWPEMHISGRVVPAVDRVYASPEHSEMFRAWARENGAAVKGNLNGRGNAWELGGEHLGYGGYVVPSGDVDGVDFFPYLDTFRFQDESGNLCANDEEDETVYEYCCTGGGREERNRHEGQVQLHDGTWHDEDDAYEVDGEYYASEDVVMCHRSDEYILRNGAYEIELGRNNTIHISAEYVTEL
jgi:hypothetical protein